MKNNKRNELCAAQEKARNEYVENLLSPYLDQLKDSCNTEYNDDQTIREKSMEILKDLYRKICQSCIPTC